jgi:diphthine-ammonia ligase
MHAHVQGSLRLNAQIVALGNLLPADDAVDELDSWMFQTVGHQLVAGYATACGLPLLRRRICGASRHTVSLLDQSLLDLWVASEAERPQLFTLLLQELGYRETAGDEVEDLAALLAFAKERFPVRQPSSITSPPL